MIKKVAITGHTKGLGKDLASAFSQQGWEVHGFSRHNGFDLEYKSIEVANAIQGFDLFINNAYAAGKQLDMLKLCHGKVKNEIVIGSTVADFPDSSMPEYSINKQQLQTTFRDFANSRDYDLLLLKLSGSSYHNVDKVMPIINFWLEYKTFNEITFRV